MLFLQKLECMNFEREYDNIFDIVNTICCSKRKHTNFVLVIVVYQHQQRRILSGIKGCERGNRYFNLEKGYSDVFN